MNLFKNIKQVNKDNCKQHVFEILREASANTDSGHGGEIHMAVSKCKKCGLTLETSNAIMHAAYQEQAKATNILAITTIISFTTLMLVAVGLYLDYVN